MSDFKQIPAVEFLEQFDPDIRPALLGSLRTWSEAVGMICFSNHDLSHSECGHRFALCYGPDNTVTSIEDLVLKGLKCPVQPPEGRMAWRYYADNYASRKDLLLELEQHAS